MPVKLSLEFIRSEFEKEDYTLLTTEYINNKQKLEYICPEGHKHSINWNNWKTGWRCPHCSCKIKKTIVFVKSEFSKEGYNLISEEYCGKDSKLVCICPYDHQYQVSWNDWRNGRRCSTCAIINMCGDKHHNWKGGISCEPYCDIWLDKEFKESILERDNHECQNPDCWQTSKKLTVHHIDYNKKNCRPKNLITLCNSCNVRANYNRSYWKKLYNASKFKRLALGKGKGVRKIDYASI